MIARNMIENLQLMNSFFKFKFALSIERFSDARILHYKKNRVTYGDLYQAFSPCSDLFS